EKKPNLRRVAILGSTGSIGRQALEVISMQPAFFEVELLCANSNADILIRQAKAFRPNCVVIADESKYEMVKEALYNHDVKVYAGTEAICQAVQMESIDI